MIDDEIYTPKDPDFFDWDYEPEECIEQLALILASTGSKSTLLADWVAISVETMGINYYKGNNQQVQLLSAGIAKATEKYTPDELAVDDLLLCCSLRVLLCQPNTNIDINKLTELYNKLPAIPTPATLDVYIMFQCYFGATNALQDWKNNFERYEKEHQWCNYNKVQLVAGITYANDSESLDKSLLMSLEQELYNDILSLEEDPYASDWLPWLKWYIEEKMS
jgi:hypothetical protein